MKAEYDEAAAAWADVPAQVYARFAATMFEHTASDVRGARVLDVGAGTAVASDAALAHGAGLAVASDISIEMLRRRSPTIPAVAADAARLPFDDVAFDLVVSAFSLGHLVDPEAALREWRRVAPRVLVSTFAPGPPHPVKTAVDDAVEGSGFVPPAWYERIKSELGPGIEDPRSLTALARAAGYRRIDVARASVDTGLATPEEMVAWRFGMAHLAPFVASLSTSRRAEVHHAALEAVAGLAPVSVEIQLLSAH